MITLKKFDFWGQIVATVACVLYGILFREGFFAFYFIVGSWQVISTITHLYSKNTLTTRGRQFYNIFLVAIAILVALGLIIPAILYLMLYVLLFVSPCLAIWYATICYKEIEINQYRALVHFK
jgi:hypothetical protein